MVPFGLDLSDAIIRLVVLHRKGREWTLPIRAEIPVPEGLIVDGEIKNPGGTVDLLKELLKATNEKLRHAIVALPERHTFIKQISIPADQAGKIDNAIQNVASQHLPYAWEEVYQDWQLLGPVSSLGEQRVLLGAAPKTLVDGYLSVLDQAGIETVAMDIESLAVARASFQESETGAHLLLDLGRTRSTIILVLDGTVLFSATVRYAGKELNRFIADSLHITMAQAERAKTIFGLDARRGKGVLKKVLTPQLGILVEKIHDVMSFYQEHLPGHPPIETISVTGSGAMLRGIDQALTDLLERPVTVRPAWIYKQLHLDDHHLTSELPFTYATAFGLALGNFTNHV